MPAPALPEATSIICVFLILLVPFAIAGLALINTGLGRSHGAAHTMLASLCVFAVACGAISSADLRGKVTSACRRTPWSCRESHGIGLARSRSSCATWSWTDRPVRWQRCCRCSAWLWRRSFPWERESIAGASPPFAPRRLCWPAGPILVRALGVGRRVAGATGSQLRARARLC